MAIVNGYDSRTRERVLLVNDLEGTNPQFWEDFRNASSAWTRFAKIYGDTEANRLRIVDILMTMYPNQDHFTHDQVKHAFITGINSGGNVSDPLERIQVEIAEQEPEPVPVGRDGKPLSASQIAWGEMTRWSETATSAQVAERRRTDPAYASFYHKNLVRSFEGVGDGVVEQNPHLLPQGAPTTAALKDERLVSFARRYAAMSAAEIRAARSKAINPLTSDQFEKDLNESIRLKLI